MSETTETQKNTPLGACARILLAAALWGIIGLWNRRLMAGGFSPTDIVVVRNFGGMALLAAYLAEKRQGQTLESWLDGVFAAGSGSTLPPDPADAAGFEAFLTDYHRALPVEQAAGTVLP